MTIRNSDKAFVYYAIALALAIVVRLAVPTLGQASLPVTMLTPAIAVVIMLVFVAPEGGLRQAAYNLGLTRLGLKAWPFAIIAPALIFTVGVIILVLAGFTTLAVPQTSISWPLLAIDILISLIISSLFSACEEIGWRGYMLPRMKGFSMLGAMLVVGFLHGLWHMPLLLTTDYYHSTGNPWLVVPLFLITLTLAGVFYGCLRIWSGSVWPVAIAHGAVNAAWNVSSQISQTKSPVVLEYVGGESGIIVIAGLVVANLVFWKILQRQSLVKRIS